MDDPTRRCENDTDNETHSPGPPIPSGGLIFVRTYFRVGRHFCLSSAAEPIPTTKDRAKRSLPASKKQKSEQLSV